jgi:hypothetical protein
MGTLSLYHWDFNRLPKGIDPRSLTCSIAIFQWQPRASGKGLKKVNACRVCGYLIEPDRLYEKAREICDRLNAEGASVSKRPAWLQKQYSVPRPKGLMLERPRDELPASALRTIRRRKMQQVLIPEGFVEGAQGTYIRRRDNQIHLLNFQASKWGGEYTINLGFHYTFLPPQFAGKRIRLADYDELDCALRARIGDFIPGGLDRWFEYGKDRGRLATILEENARLCLTVLERYARRWRQPEKWLTVHPVTAAALRRRTRPWLILESPAAFMGGIAVHCNRWNEPCSTTAPAAHSR